MTQEEKLLIDRYLENTLTGYELKNFLDKLEAEEVFRREVSFHNLLIESVQEADDNRIKSTIEKHIGFKKPAVPFALKLIVTFLIVTAGGIVIWNYTDTDSGGARKKYFSLDFFRHSKVDKPITLNEEKLPKDNKSIKKNIPVVSDSNEYVDAGNTLKIDSIKTDRGNEEEIIIKKDQLLISITLKSKSIGKHLSGSENSEAAVAKSTANKLNPEGDLPEEAKLNDENYLVEFWISPVNYKGYKLINNKLILFGIEAPDAVRLYSDDSRLWMKYGVEYYSLTPTESFEALNQSYEFPSALK